MFPRLFLSLIIPILKGRELDPSDPSNYRGISVASTFSKLFKVVILELFLAPLVSKLHCLQGGFRPGLSTSHTSFILQESIAWCKESNLKSFVAFLDARKAFDTVWHSGLFFKLDQFGLSGIHYSIGIDTFIHESNGLVLSPVLFLFAKGLDRGPYYHPFFTQYTLTIYW